MLTIRSGGRCGFLNPPGHAEHFWHVENSHCSISLSGAISESWVDKSVKEEAQKLINDNPGNVNDLDWICHVMGYFKSCYQGKNGSWNASDLEIDRTIDPVYFQDFHAGVHFIRQFNPSFQLTQEIVDNAYWGKKKDAN